MKTAILLTLVSTLAVVLSPGVANGQYSLSGQVVVDINTPVSNATVTLSGSNSPDKVGTVLGTTLTDAGGYYTHSVDVNDANDNDYINLTVEKSGYVPLSASTIYGTVKGPGWIQFAQLAQNSTGNDFRLKPANSTPVAGDDSYTVDEDTPLIVAAPGVLGNDTDADGDPLTAVLDAGPLNGTLTLNANGSFTYIPNTNFNGGDSFTYKASDGALDSNVATVTITVKPVNDAPVVDAGSDQVVVVGWPLPEPPFEVQLEGWATDDGEPDPPGELTIEWSKDSGPGVVEFINKNDPGTIGRFYASGTYVLKLTAFDGELYSSDTVTIVIQESPPENQPPVVDAGPDEVLQTESFPFDFSPIMCSATDDGKPDPPGKLTLEWSESEPDKVDFDDRFSLHPIVTFYEPGTYVFTLTASDGELSGSDIVTIVIEQEPPLDNQPPVVVSLMPPDDATGVAVNTNLVIEFDEPVQKGSGNIVIRNSSDDYTLETIYIASPMFEITGGTVTIDIGPDLSPAAAYYVQIDAGAIQDLSGNNFPGITDETTWNFTTSGVTLLVVDAGPDQDIVSAGGGELVLSDSLDLSGSYFIAEEDSFEASGTESLSGATLELEGGELTVTPDDVDFEWTLVSAPGRFEIQDACDLSTTGKPYMYGTYVLKLTARYGQKEAFDIVKIRISDPFGNLVAYYPFYEGEGTIAHDCSGNNHHGTLYGDPQWMDDPDQGWALDFDDDDYVLIDHDEAFNLTEQITVAGLPEKECRGPIVAKGDAWRLYALTEGELVRFGFDLGTEYLEGSQLYPAGEWHHVVGTYDGKTMRLYVDGELDGEKLYTFGILFSDAPVTIGGGDPEDPFAGSIDEVRIYSRALTADQVKMLSAPAGDIDFDGVVDYKDAYVMAGDWLIEADYDSLRDHWDKPGIYLNLDIGNPEMPGSASYDEVTDTFTVTGGGVDIWHIEDQFDYVYEPVSGDAQITALVNFDLFHGPWMKSGLMFRETLEADSKQAMMIITPGYGAAFQWRPNTAGVSFSSHGGEAADVQAPVRLRIERSENTFTGSYFDDENGVWRRQGSANIQMADDIYVGLAVTSHDEGELATATFNNVVSPPMAERDIGIPGKPGDSWIDRTDGNLTVVGSGRDIWDTKDQFHYVHQVLSGDGVITARIASMATDDTWNLPSLLLRQRAETHSEDAGHDLLSIKPDSADIWDQVDELRYAYEPLSVDGLITARVSDVRMNDWAKSGLMIRETLEADSTHATMLVTGGGRVALQSRPITGDVSHSSHFNDAPQPGYPVCLRLERTGDTFTGYYSDGSGWKRLASVNIPMKKDVYVGMAVTSHDEETFLATTFDQACVFSEADLYQDGRVDFKDYAILAQRWLEGLPGQDPN